MRKDTIQLFYLFIFTLLLLNTFNGYSQKEASVFMFNTGEVLDFNTKSSTFYKRGSGLTPSAIASICNHNGELLFYTDGASIYDSWNKIIPGGFDLTWTVQDDQFYSYYPTKIIIPVGVNEKKYYLVTTDASTLWVNKGNGLYTAECCYKNDTTTCYTSIEVNSGKQAQVLQKDIPLLKNGSTVLAATKHANGIDTWLLTTEYNNNYKRIYAFLFTECGVMPPVITTLNSLDDGHGYVGRIIIRISPNGKKLFIKNPSYIKKLCDFDNSTGIISNEVDMNSPVLSYDAVFSPKSNYLYLLGDYNSSSPKYLYQYDVANKTCDSIYMENNEAMNNFSYNMTPGIDGKLYFITTNGGLLSGSQISSYVNPDNPLNKVNFIYKQWNTLADIYPQLSYFISNYFDPNYSLQTANLGIPEILTTRGCIGENIQFKVNKTGAVNEYKWDFGDGTAIDNNQEPAHAYNQPGTYTIQLVVRYSCLTDTIRQQIVIDEAIAPPVGDTVYTCQTAIFNAGGNYASYLWNTGEKTSKITVSNAGAYRVQLKDGCGSYETTYHSVRPKATLYNLITPDGNEKNDKLAFPEYSLPATLQVYDRWGKLVYQNSNYLNEWKGEGLSEGIYYYKFNYQGCPEAKSWVQVVR